MDTKAKFQQFLASFMEEPMRDQEKRVEQLVRENERLRLEISAKTDLIKELDDTKSRLNEIAEENTALRQEVTDEVRSGVERVQERNHALTQAKRENAGLKQAIANRDELWSQERLKYKQQIKLLRSELQWEMYSHSQLRKNVGILRGQEGNGELSPDEDQDGYISPDEEEEEEEDEEQRAASQVEQQLQTERSLQSSALRRASRRLQVEETPDIGKPDFDDSDEAESNDEDNDEDLEHLSEDDSVEQTPHDEDGEEQDDDEPEAEPALRRSTRSRNADTSVNDISPARTKGIRKQTAQIIGTKRGRDESNDTTADGAFQIPDRQTGYTSSRRSRSLAEDSDRPVKRTRRQTERYTSALETTRKLAKIMTPPPTTSPTFLPTVLPRRSTNRSPARKVATTAQFKAQSPKSRSTNSTPRTRRNLAPKSPATTGPKPSKPKTYAKSPRTLAKRPNSIIKSPQSTKKSDMPNGQIEFTILSGYKHGKGVICPDQQNRALLTSVITKATNRIHQVAVTPTFWRSTAYRRVVTKKNDGEPIHCAFTSQFAVDSDEVETENPWTEGEDFACINCSKEGIACFTVFNRVSNEKYEALYRPPKGR